jgi:PIN domain nuclease of toxin-antitoxin system
LSKVAQAQFLNNQNELFLSAASYWEICIKHGSSKLKLAPKWEAMFEREIAANSIQWLSIEKEHCRGILALPPIHGDPFDRLLVAQALQEGLTIITADIHIAQYQVDTLW